MFCGCSRFTLLTSFKEVSGKLSSVSIKRSVAVEQIRRKRSARLKGTIFF